MFSQQFVLLLPLDVIEQAKSLVMNSASIEEKKMGNFVLMAEAESSAKKKTEQRSVMSVNGQAGVHCQHI